MVTLALCNETWPSFPPYFLVSGRFNLINNLMALDYDVLVNWITFLFLIAHMANTGWSGLVDTHSPTIYCSLLPGRIPSTLWKRNSLSFPWYFPKKVPKFHEKYFPFNEVAGKSRSGSSPANCYCLERCVILTKATITSQSMNTTWTHGTKRTYPKQAKTFLFWVTVTNSFFCVFFPNSLSFP